MKPMEVLNYLKNTRPVQKAIEDLSSLRAMWNWIILALFCWCTVYMTLTNQHVHGVLITVLGGVITAIFTNYVFSTTYERVKGISKKNERANDKPEPSETGASD